MEFRTIRQTSHINGENRNPNSNEDGKTLVWDDTLGKFIYVTLPEGIVLNTKTEYGYVSKGDDADAGSYIWKLDESKNPAWRKEEYLFDVSKNGNSILFTMNSGDTFTASLGALAWLDNVESIAPVTSVFGRTGDIVAEPGDYDASEVTNAFDLSANTLDDILEGTTNKFFTATIKADVDANTLARHTHSNKDALDLITDTGGGVIPTDLQIGNWDDLYTNYLEYISDHVADILQDNGGITWVYDDVNDTITPYLSGVNQVYPLYLNASSDVATRISGLVEGTDYPTGWSLTVDSAVNLSIVQNTDKKLVDIKVFEVEGGIDRIAKPFSDAYSGFYQNGTTIMIEGLDTLAVDLRIELIFR